MLAERPRDPRGADRRVSGYSAQRCITVLSGRWIAMVLSRLLDGTWCYGALAAALRRQVSERALTPALRELAADGVPSGMALGGG